MYVSLTLGEFSYELLEMSEYILGKLFVKAKYIFFYPVFINTLIYILYSLIHKYVLCSMHIGVPQLT